MSTLEKALLLARIGLSIIPILENTKKPAIPSWTQYQEKPATPEAIRQWFTGTNNTVGVVTGAVSGVVVVDLDNDETIKHAKNNLPPTPFVVKTGKGQHWFYKHPGTKITNKARIKTGLVGLELDLRGDGGYVLAPGAKHPSGSSYEILKGWELLQEGVGFDSLPVFNPDWLKNKANTPAPTAAKNTPSPTVSCPSALERCAKYVSRIPGAPEGQRNATANDVAFKITQGFCQDDEHGYQILVDWNLRCLPPLEKGELRCVWDSAKSAKSADRGFLLDATCKTQQTPAHQPFEPVQEPTREHNGPFVRESALIRLNLIGRGEVSDNKLPMLDVNAPPKTLLNSARAELQRQVGIPKIVVGPAGLGYVSIATRSLIPILSPKALRVRLQDVMSFGSVSRKDEVDRIRQVQPPLCLTEELFELPPLEVDAPLVRQVVDTPTFSRDGKLVTVEGYDPEAKLILIKDPSLKIPAVSEFPTADEVRISRELILESFRDFPLVGPPDLANLVALMLSPFVREMTGPAPLTIINAPTPGSGKTLALEVAMVPTLGVLGGEKKHPYVQFMNEFREEDAEKEIASTLLLAPKVIILDNVNKKLSSGALAKILSSEHSDHRRLGSSNRTSILNTSIWAGTGNNVTMSDEISRRTVLVRINPDTERPEERTNFKHADLLGWCKANRGRLIWAVLTLVQRWLSLGRPTGERVVLGSFQKWADTLGGILHCAGIPGLLGNRRDQAEAVDEESAEWRNFYQAWWQTHREQRVTSLELMELVRSCASPTSIFNKPNEQGQITALGQQLGKKIGRIYAGFKAEKLGQIDGKMRYKLTPSIDEACSRLLDKSAVPAGKTPTEPLAAPQPTQLPLDLDAEGIAI